MYCPVCFRYHKGKIAKIACCEARLRKNKHKKWRDIIQEVRERMGRGSRSENRRT